MLKEMCCPKILTKKCIHQATLEADAQRGNERAEGAEKKITDIEEELRCLIFLYIIMWQMNYLYIIMWQKNYLYIIMWQIVFILQYVAINWDMKFIMLDMKLR